MKKIKKILKIAVISIVIIGLVATYLLAGLAPTPRKETAPVVDDYLDAEYVESYNDTEALTPAEGSIEFSGPPAGEMPHTNGPSTPPPAL